MTGKDGNISKDPLFQDATGGDYQITRDSSCADAGDDAAPNLPTNGFFGFARKLDGNRDNKVVVDIGANEYSGRRLFGANCAGSGGFAPSIALTGGMPFTGNTLFMADLTGAFGGARAALVLGRSNKLCGSTSLPLTLGFLSIPDCQLAVSPDECFYATANGSGAGQGSAVLPLPIPAVAAIRGTTIFAPWWVGDPGPALAPGTVSKAMQIDIQ